MKNLANNSTRHAEGGFSLVDVMVGMVLSLIGTIIIFQVFSVSESIKRTTTSGGDAQQSGAAALLAMERALKEAGYGLFASDPVSVRIPVQLTVNAAATPDSIAITARRDWDFGPFAPANSAVFPAPPAAATEIFSVNNNAQLVSNINGVIADGVVQLKTQYGTDSDGNGTISDVEWVTTVPASYLQVLAIRLVAVVRSAQPEASSTGSKDPAACDTTQTGSPSLVWVGGTVNVSGNIGLAAGDNWQCYRYKTFQVTVPLRNVLWRP
jgi:Tfp pilus assembly protein PilW